MKRKNEAIDNYLNSDLPRDADDARFEKIKRLGTLYDKGLVSKDEYRRMIREIREG